MKIQDNPHYDPEWNKETKEAFKLAIKLRNSSKLNWFDRNDLDEHLYGIANRGTFDNHTIESDAPYLQLFPQDLLDSLENSLSAGCSALWDLHSLFCRPDELLTNYLKANNLPIC